MDLRPLNDAEDDISPEAFTGDVIFNERVDLDEVIALSFIALNEALDHTLDLMEVELTLLCQTCPLIDLLLLNTSEANKSRL